MVEHGDALGETDDDLHAVLDEEDRLALLAMHRADQRREAVHVLSRDAGHRLVQQDHVGFAREHHGELQLALVTVRERSRGPRGPIREPHPRERPRCTVECRSERVGPTPDPERPSQACLGCEPDVLERAEPREDARDLERPPEPRTAATRRRTRGDVLPPQLDPAGRRWDEPRDEVEQRRLPGAVRPDDGDQLAGPGLERHILDDARTADVQPEAAGREHGRPVHVDPLRSRLLLLGRCDVPGLERLRGHPHPLVALPHELGQEIRLDHGVV